MTFIMEESEIYGVLFELTATVEDHTQASSTGNDNAIIVFTTGKARMEGMDAEFDVGSSSGIDIRKGEGVIVKTSNDIGSVGRSNTSLRERMMMMMMIGKRRMLRTLRRIDVV